MKHSKFILDQEPKPCVHSFSSFSSTSDIKTLQQKYKNIREWGRKEWGNGEIKNCQMNIKLPLKTLSILSNSSNYY